MMSSENQLPRVLFVCTGNAGRSQLAQAMYRQRTNESVNVESAGVEPWKNLHPMAVQLMRERDVDDSRHHPKGVAEIADQAFDVVVSIGDPAREKLPQRMKGNPYRIHWNIADPADADETPSSEAVFRDTLAQIDQRIPDLHSQISRIYQIGNLYRQPGINSGLWETEVLNPHHLKTAAEAGFKAMEVSPYTRAEHFDFRDAAQIERIRQASQDYGMPIWSLHSRDVGDLTSPDASVRRAQMDELYRCLDAADILGATAVVSHIQIIGKHFADLPAAEARLAEGMNELTPRAEKSVARIALENGYARREGQWARDMFRRATPFSPAAFGYVLDTGHANIAGDMDDIEKGIGERLISLHLNDNDGEQDIHLTGGKGNVDWTRVAKLLHTTNYTGCLMWEIGVGRDDFDPQMLTDTMIGHRSLMQHIASSD
jgi:sugar phosphate isomerase/epimerase/protein-tyrosine-phosphatase